MTGGTGMTRREAANYKRIGELVERADAIQKRFDALGLELTVFVGNIQITFEECEAILERLEAK